MKMSLNSQKARIDVVFLVSLKSRLRNAINACGRLPVPSCTPQVTGDRAGSHHSSVQLRIDRIKDELEVRKRKADRCR